MLSMHTQHSPKVFGVEENKVKSEIHNARNIILYPTVECGTGLSSKAWHDLFAHKQNIFEKHVNLYATM